MNLVMLGGIGDFCKNMAGILKFVGIVLWIFKIAIPVIIVIMGMLDLGKAVTASKDDEIKKAMKQLAIRLLSGVLIFFIPTIIMFVFRIISEFNTIENETGFSICEACILKPTGETCTAAAVDSEGNTILQ